MFNCCSNCALSWVDKFTTGTQRFVSLVVKAVTLLPSQITQFANQVRVRLISQLIKGISRFLQTLFRYFNVTAIFVFIVPSY